MTETSAAVSWAYGVLTADSGVTALVESRVYDSIAPDGATFPYLMLAVQSATEDGTSLDGQAGIVNLLLMVKAITQSTGYGSAETLYEAAHVALQGQTGSTQGVDIKSCVRDNSLRYTEVREGIPYKHLGGVYRIFCAAI